MRILFLNPTGGLGGAETALLEVMAGLAGRFPSWRLGLIAASDGPFVARAQALGIDVQVLPFGAALARVGESGRAGIGSFMPSVLRAARAGWPLFRYFVGLRRLIREFAPDIVHSNGLKMHLLGAWARPEAAALVWHLHDYVGNRSVGSRALKRCALAASAVVTPSKSVADDFRSLGGALPPVHTIANAVDLARFAPEGDTLDLDDRAGLPRSAENVVRVGLVATFAWWKGHQTFLEAIARLPPPLPVRAYVIGGAVYQTAGSQVSIENLRAEAERLGLSGRVGFTGFIDDPAPAIRALDIVVHASTRPEPFGLAIAEGMACGRAVVTTYRGGARELVTPGRDALACTPGDPASLARVIEQLATDSPLRRNLGEAARATGQRRFDRQRLVREIAGVYEGIAPRVADAPDRLRVLHVHSGNLYGGVETFLATVAEDETVRPLMDSSFAVCFEGRFSRELMEHGHVPYFLGAARASRPLTVTRARRALSRLLASRRFDVVVCHEAWAHALFAAAIRRRGLPLAFWRHTAGNGGHWAERWARREKPDVAIANSRFTAEGLSLMFPDTAIETVYCPLRFSAGPSLRPGQREQIRRSLHTPIDHVVVMQAGRLESLKGYREALEALASLRDVPGWTYWIVGGAQSAGEERYLRELKAAALRLGVLPRVRFVGERHDVPGLLMAADVYCQPNVRPEAFGLSLVEAQGAGLPVVTSSFGGALEIVDDSCGLLVAPGDVDALAMALRRLLCDASLRARLGEAGRNRASELFDRGRQLTRTYEVLSRAVRRPGATAMAQTATAAEPAGP